MIESVVALLMFVNGEIKEACIQESRWDLPNGKRVLRDNIQNQYLTNAGRVMLN